MTTRFWAKVDRSGECWLWTAAKNNKGYGVFKVDGKLVLAHRLSWEIANGEIQDGLCMDHLCHTPHCVKPSHLRVVTKAQNNQNKSGARTDNRSGARGVKYHPGRAKPFQARVNYTG